MATVTAQGIQGKSLNDYLSDLTAALKAIDPNFNIDPDTPDGQKLGIDSEIFANLDEAVVFAYRSKDPDSAEGESLDNIGAISGVPRQAATYSVAPVVVSGVAGTAIPSGANVRSSADNTVWTLNTGIVIGVSGSGNGFVTCATPGRVVADVGDLSIIGTPYAGWASVTNPNVATQGQAQESDSSYRVRREASVSLAGNNQLDNMTAKVNAVDGVTSAKIYENVKDVADANGIPKRSLAIVVNGGTDQAVGEAIRSKKNPGVALFPRWDSDTDSWVDDPGTNGVEVEVASPQDGIVYPITFQRAKAAAIHVAIQVKKIGNLPADIGQRLAKAVAADSSKTLFDGDTAVGFNKNGYDIGEVVPPGRLYTPVNKILGEYGDSYATSITIGVSAGSLSSVPIQPAYNELATFDEANIVTTVTT